ncbi:MAG: protein translocase subunit SecD [bacterium]|nr:protein translocase subunit SecD [bacterium]
MNSLEKLLSILILSLLAIFICLPGEFKIRDFTLQRPSLDLKLGKFEFKRDLELKLGLDLAGGSHLVFEADTSALSTEEKSQAVESARDAIERRINAFGVSEAIVQTAKVGTSERIIIELPGVKDVKEATDLIGKTAQLDFRELTNEKEATGSADKITLENTKSTGFTGNDFKIARVEFDQTDGSPIIGFETKPESAKKFGEITAGLVGRKLAIFLDEEIVSAPTVQVPITEGRGTITGQYTVEGARSFAKLLNAGALPVPIKILEQRTVEASLGAQSVRASVLAGLVGLGAVLIFMTLYYGRLGIVASAGLLIYAALTLAIYKLIPIVLTLPGVAGFILSVGMAVDSNILTFERMKEDLRAGKSWSESLEASFGRAWDSIRDANIATLLTAFILFNPLNFGFLHTSGPVRGFALTLALGIAISLFTGLVVSRTLLRIFAKGGKR